MDGFVRGQLFANIYIGVPYSTVIAYMTDNEVNPNVTFQIVAGQLPGGILFNETTGELYGTATPFAETHDVQVSTINGHDILTVRLNICATVSPPLKIGPLSKIIILQKGQFFAQKIAVDGGVGKINYSCHGLPCGLYCHGTTGVIYGQPIAFGGDTTITITVMDSQNTTDTVKVIIRMVQDDDERY